MKAIIPVAGIGMRLRPFTHTVPKALMNVAGRSILEHIIDKVIAFGVTDIVLIVGHFAEVVKEHVVNAYPDVKFEFILQEERKGLGHAVLLAKDCFAAGESVIIILGDTIFDADYERIIKGDKNVICVKQVPDPRRFGVVVTEGDKIIRAAEKPDPPISDLAIVGIYRINDSAQLFRAIEELVARDVKLNNEYQLTDALQLMIESGIDMRAVPIGGWYDCGRPETLLETNRILLEQSGGNSKSAADCIIVPPVYIDPSAQVTESVIGPYVSIAQNAKVTRSIIRNSILNERAEVSKMILDESILGIHATVRGISNHLNIGDSSKIDFMHKF